MIGYSWSYSASTDGGGSGTTEPETSSQLSLRRYTAANQITNYSTTPGVPRPTSPSPQDQVDPTHQSLYQDEAAARNGNGAKEGIPKAVWIGGGAVLAVGVLFVLFR